MFRFTIRDVLWLTVLVAMGMGWWMADRRWRQRDEMEHLRFHQVLRDIVEPYRPTKSEVWGPYQGPERKPAYSPQ